MKSFNGEYLYVGLNVIVLQVPVVNQHQFKKAKITSITDKKVYVEYSRKDRWGEEEITTVSRYPEQIIVL